jgi:hypothetical protein
MLIKKLGFLQPLKNLGSPQERKNKVDLGSSKKGRITKGRITKGRITKGRITKGRIKKGRMKKG